MPGTGEWIGPELIAAEHYEEVRLIVDGDGYAHVAAAAGDGIFYLTNATGSWARERLTSAPTDGYDGEPSIVIRDDGSVAIAFGRFGGLACTFGCVPVDPQGIFLTTNRSGSWSDAVRIVEGRVQEPSLQATEGRLHLAYSRGVGPLNEIGDEDRIVEYTYADDDIGTWALQAVGDGRAPSLRIGRDGLVRITFDQRYRADNLYYAAQADSGEFVVERVPGDWIVYTQALLALSATDEPQIVAYNEGEESRAMSVRRTGGTWSDASAVFPDYEFCCLKPADIATDGDGTSHVISAFALSGGGVWYANNSGGDFRDQQLRTAMGSVSDIPDGASAIAIDESGRPHVLYVVSEYDESPRDETGLWYGIGPSALPILQ